MTDKEFGIELVRRLQEVDDTCSTCIHCCSNSEIGDLEICYEGMKAYAEKELENDNSD